MIEDNGLKTRDRECFEKKVLLLKKTKWIDDIIDRYFFERVLNRLSPPGCTFFLEKQILNELARIVFRDKLRQIWDHGGPETGISDVVDLAIRFIEANLFEKLSLEQIAAVAKISDSTLLRLFKKLVGHTPYKYIKIRRLDEAAILLKKGDLSVGDVAVLIGYEDFSAFAKAFRTHFGQPPSSFCAWKR